MRTYSVRFCHGRGATVKSDFQVPPGRRAVVRFLSINAFAGTSNYAYMEVAGVPVVYWQTPAQFSTRTYDGRWTAYAGEWVTVAAAGEDVAFHASGFLFDDTLGRELERSAGGAGDSAGAASAPPWLDLAGVRDSS